MTNSGEPTDKFRTLIYSAIFDTQYEELNTKFDIEGAVEVLEWLVCQNPYRFPLIQNDYRVAETVESIKAPALRVLFLVINDDLIKMCFIEEETIEELEESF